MKRRRLRAVKSEVAVADVVAGDDKSQRRMPQLPMQMAASST
jgi:hypothetical protein